MRILVIAATMAEIAPFVRDNPAMEILITGVGAPATIYHLQKRIQSNNIQLVVQAGIAGAFSPDTGLTKVVLVERDTFGDIGTEEKEKFIGIFQSGFADKDSFPYTGGWLINSTAILHQAGLPLVKGVTINKVSDSLLQKQQLIGNFLPDVESMEGAALHYVCLQENIPFLQIRSISNLIGERDKKKWKLQEAVSNLNIALKNLVDMAANPSISI